MTEAADADVTDEMVAEPAPVAAGTVDIPKQQSAGAAADSEAGEGASK
ncbi:gliding motility protein [Streptomyces sp. SR27]|nr:gliding motility protein [Streptomyces sp. SR27]MDV9192480.1 gliding motility protein [Streptomyces sp. SR27]